MGDVAQIPLDVLNELREIFGSCNEQVTRKLSMAPNVQEESLDQSWVEHLSHRSSPTTLSSEWTIAIETHYLGGLRHYKRWEIADIGVLVFARFPDGSRTNKVALLQSKRLYPTSGPVRVETPGDFQTGFARLADPESWNLSIGLEREFRFDSTSRYGALRLDSDQARAIVDYERARKLKVYYQLYNPWSVPFEQVVPLRGYLPPTGRPDLGIRIVPATAMHREVPPDRNPSLGDIAKLSPIPDYGWRLEDFICDEVLACREGDKFNSIDEDSIQTLFYRRSGPISAAIAVTIEAPAPSIADQPDARRSSPPR